MSSTKSKALVAKLYDALYRKDADGVGALFADDGIYTDVGSPADDVVLLACLLLPSTRAFVPKGLAVAQTAE